MNRLTARINWLWRLVMTGFCFVLFGVGGLLLSLVWFNLLLIVQRDRTNRRRLARRSIAASFRFFLTVARGLGVLDYRIHNLDALRNDRGCLVVATRSRSSAIRPASSPTGFSSKARPIRSRQPALPARGR